MYELKGKVAVVTGAGSGIGRALARLLAEKGCALALADIDEAGLKETAAGLKTKVLTQKLDVADRAAVYAFAETVKTKFGTAHVVINNAGVAVSQTIQNLEYQDFEWLMGVNFWGVVYGTKAFLPMLVAQNEGAIVNISSVFGLFGWPAQGAYNAAKFAVRGFTECLRIELRDTQVKAISVHPGGIKTNIVKNARIHVDFKGRRDAKAMADEFQRMAQTTPEKAAQIIVDGIERGKPRVLVGPDAVMMDKIQRLLPESYSKVLLGLADRIGKRGQP